MARNKGFSIVEIVIVLAIVGLIGVLAWRFWDASQTSPADTSTESTTQTAPNVNSDADLNKADQSLDSTDVEGSESQQLDTQTSF
jgi:prepilin-type N-terminal cleavage/methylation domain-containing protein